MLREMAQVSLRDEAVDVLQELIRVDTVNPPGNETRAAELLRAYLESSASSTPRCLSGRTWWLGFRDVARARR